MVGWSHLPPEIKHHVVKKLDFMSRHSLKSTSYTVRQIVNSTPLKIPRVRFGHKNGSCLIVIYTGVEQFLRWELFDEDDGVTIQRCENCYDTAEFKRKTIQKTDSFQVGIRILKSLLAHKSIKIDVFEWDMPYEGRYNFFKKMRFMTKYLNGDRFRATQVVFFQFFEEAHFFHGYANVFCCEVEEFKLMYGDQMNNYLAPLKILEFKTITDDTSKTAMFIFYEPLDGFDVPLEEKSEKKIIYLIEREIGIFPAQEVQRSERQDLVKYTYTTNCGKYIISMLPKDEQFIKNQLIDMKCGMSWMCKTCADLFEYWYYRNLTMRLIHEPFWAFALEGNAKPSPQMMKLLKQKMKKRSKFFKPSWGFKKIPPKLRTTEKPKKKNIRREELQKRGKTTGLPKFFVWFGVFLLCYVAFSIVLNLVK